MLIIVSPTKQMKCTNTLPAESLPVYKKEAKCILNVLTTLSVQDIQRIMRVNESIAQENLERYKRMRFDMKGTPAITTYQGLQFQHMRMHTFDTEDWAYVRKHQRILSGFYGVLRPFDSIYPYRLEMKCKVTITNTKDMYTYWKDKLANQLRKEMKTHKEQYILNLASKEYAQGVLPYMDEVVSVVFYVVKEGILKMESTQVKMARGAMVRYLVKQKVTCLQGVKDFTEMDYRYREDLSNKKELIFVKGGTV